MLLLVLLHRTMVGEAMRPLQRRLQVLDMGTHRGGELCFVCSTKPPALMLPSRWFCTATIHLPSGYQGQNNLQAPGYVNPSGYYRAPSPQSGTCWIEPRVEWMLTGIAQLPICPQRKCSIMALRAVEFNNSLLSNTHSATVVRRHSVYVGMGPHRG